MSVRRHIVCDECGRQAKPYSHPQTARSARAALTRAGWECSPELDTCPACVAARPPKPLHVQLADAGVQLQDVADLAMCSVADVRAVLNGSLEASPLMVGMLAAALRQSVADVRAALSA